MISFRKRFLKLFSVMYSEERGTTKLAKIKEQEIFVNPYVIQMDKFADSLQHLSKTFLNMEAYKGTLSREEIDEMFEKVTGNVCAGCERRGECLGEKHSVTYQMMYEILCAAEEYGAELNMELKLLSRVNYVLSYLLLLKKSKTQKLHLWRFQYCYKLLN